MPDTRPRFVIPLHFTPHCRSWLSSATALRAANAEPCTNPHGACASRPAAAHVATPGQQRDIYDAGQTQELPGSGAF